LQAVLPQIESLGASLIVLCPQLPEFTKPGAAAQKLGFPILTDHDNQVGETYGLTFRLPDDLIEVYKKLGVNLPRYNGDESWRLSIPARIVIRADGVVAAAESRSGLHTPTRGGTNYRSLAKSLRFSFMQRNISAHGS
jgi:peroxiredoxin